MAYFSTESQTSSDVSSGVSSSRDSSKHVVTVPISKGSGTRLFKGLTMCPPLVPKKVFDPDPESAQAPSKLAKLTGSSGSHSGSLKRGQGHTGSLKKITPFNMTQTHQ